MISSQIVSYKVAIQGNKITLQNKKMQLQETKYSCNCVLNLIL